MLSFGPASKVSASIFHIKYAERRSIVGVFVLCFVHHMRSLRLEPSRLQFIRYSSEIHLFSRSAPRVIKDLESFLLVSHIVSGGKKKFKRGGKGHPGRTLTLVSSHSLSLSLLKHTPQLALFGTRVNTFCPEISGGMFTSAAITDTTALQRSWISLWIRHKAAFLIMSCWLRSFHCFRASAFVLGAFYRTGFAITSPKERIFLSPFFFLITYFVRNV